MTDTRPLPDSLRANADLTEKALDFMSDPEQIEESKTDIALWRDAADEIERLTKALTEIRMLTVEVGDSVEAATRACDIAMEALGE